MNYTTDSSRRNFLGLLGATGAGLALAGCDPQANALLPAAAAPEWARYPEKTDLILLTDRPAQLETPLHYFRQDLTPNEAHFVRWHLSGIPTAVDLNTFRLQVDGAVSQPLSLSVDDLRRDFEAVSLIAVNQCSGNSRSYYEPRVPGGQWGHGAIGNARWTGVRLKDVLQRAGASADAVDIGFGALDGPPLSSTPDFFKALAVAHAMDGEVMLAYEMNGVPPPLLNGFPLRLVVPGWYATYWVKCLNQITVHTEKFKGYWMDKAYLIPNTPNANESPDHLVTDLVPINRFSVRSLFVLPEPDAQLRAGHSYGLEGVALDSGYGIRRVEVSTDGGAHWADAQLDPELGKYSWRRWRSPWKPASTGRFRLMVRATNAAGETQRVKQWNHGGYARNEIEHIDVTVV